MDIVYAQEPTPEKINNSAFLVGPTPRDKNTLSWRPQMIKLLADRGFDGTIFTPEPRDGEWHRDYFSQTGWEKKHLDMADVILAWVPRELSHMPAFTTNVEFGRYITSNRLVYGRPDNAPKTRYLDWMYETECNLLPHNTMEDLATSVASLLEGKGVDRVGGERFVPLQIWNTEMFQQWYAAHKEAGNRLDDARVLWNFTIPKANFLFAYVLWVKVWIGSEGRYKENEFIFSRSNISSVLPVWRAENVLDSKVVLVKEFRSPVNNKDGFVHELPGGSKFKETGDVLQLAAEELQEETGLEIPAERFYHVNGRQLASTLSTHKSFLFAVNLSDDEINEAERKSQNVETFGVIDDTERTYVEVRTVKELLDGNNVDFSMMGMILEALIR